MLYSRRYPPKPVASVPEPAPKATETPDLTPALIRLAELRELYADQGWKPIKAIGDALGVEKHPDGWEYSLMAIIEAEYSAEIALALEEAIDPLQGESE
jgi:hypothetical protein